MENPDVTLTEMNGIIRVTFNTNEAKEVVENEPEIAPYINRRDDMVFFDITKTNKNKNSMIAYCISNNLKTVTE